MTRRRDDDADASVAYLYDWDTNPDGSRHILARVDVATWMAALARRTLAWRVWGEETRNKYGPVVHLDDPT